MGPGPAAARRAAPDGTLWITLYGNGKLAHVDPAAVKVIQRSTRCRVERTAGRMR